MNSNPTTHPSACPPGGSPAPTLNPAPPIPNHPQPRSQSDPSRLPFPSRLLTCSTAIRHPEYSPAPKHPPQSPRTTQLEVSNRSPTHLNVDECIIANALTEVESASLTVFGERQFFWSGRTLESDSRHIPEAWPVKATDPGFALEASLDERIGLNAPFQKHAVGFLNTGRLMRSNRAR